MSVVQQFGLLLSGGIIATSVALSWIGYSRRALTYRAAVAFTGVGVGVGGAMFLYFGVSGGDLAGSTIAGIVGGVTAAVVAGARFKHSA